MSEEKKETKFETSKIHLFKKIQHVRVELQQKELKKTGYNKFSDFYYFELGDFLPQLNELCLKYNLFTYEDITTEMARITVVDLDKLDDVFELTIPTAEVELKGANKIQSLGGLLTYARKYLYMLMFEIIDSDPVDAETGKPETKSKGKKETDTKPVVNDKKTQMKTLCTSLSANGHKQEVMDTLMKLANVKNPNSITDENIMDQIIKELEALQ